MVSNRGVYFDSEVSWDELIFDTCNQVFLMRFKSCDFIRLTIEFYCEKLCVFMLLRFLRPCRGCVGNGCW